MTEQITKQKAGVRKSRNLSKEEWAKVIVKPQVNRGNKIQTRSSSRFTQTNVMPTRFPSRQIQENRVLTETPSRLIQGNDIELSRNIYSATNAINQEIREPAHGIN